MIKKLDDYLYSQIENAVDSIFDESNEQTDNLKELLTKIVRHHTIKIARKFSHEFNANQYFRNQNIQTCDYPYSSLDNSYSIIIICIQPPQDPQIPPQFLFPAMQYPIHNSFSPYSNQMNSPYLFGYGNISANSQTKEKEKHITKKNKYSDDSESSNSEHKHKKSKKTKNKSKKAEKKEKKSKKKPEYDKKKHPEETNFSKLIIHKEYIGNPFDGIIAELTRQNSGCNVNDLGIISITGNQTRAITGTHSSVVNYHYDGNSYNSARENNPSICFDFKSHVISVTSYSIKSSGYPAPDFLVSWALQGSNDSVEWTEIDSRSNDRRLCSKRAVATFQIHDKIKSELRFQFVRIRMTGRSHDGNNQFNLTNVEFFGKYFEK